MADAAPAPQIANDAQAFSEETDISVAPPITIDDGAAVPATVETMSSAPIDANDDSCVDRLTDGDLVGGEVSIGSNDPVADVPTADATATDEAKTSAVVSEPDLAELVPAEDAPPPSTDVAIITIDAPVPALTVGPASDLAEQATPIADATFADEAPTSSVASEHVLEELVPALDAPPPSNDVAIISIDAPVPALTDAPTSEPTAPAAGATVMDETPTSPVASERALAELAPAEDSSTASTDVAIIRINRPVPVLTNDPQSDPADDVTPLGVTHSRAAETPVAEIVPVVVEISPDPAALVDGSGEIEQLPSNDPVPVATVVVETPPTGAAPVVTALAAEPVEEPPAPKALSAPKPRAKATQPVDRATLIRQRWAETGIRMWNPRMHGTGDAALNIQGRVELLPPAPGETMPRYDKLEFRMLGGQIVCEGIIVEAPARTSQRSFTRLAESGRPERNREPARERQAALA